LQLAELQFNLIESNTMKKSLITPKLYYTPPPSTRREVMKKGLGLTLGTSALGLAGLGASSSAQAWSSWHTTSFINNADTQRGDINWPICNSLATRSGIYRAGMTWTGVNVYWRNSKDAMWKDGFVRFYDASGEIQAMPFNFNHTNNPNGYKDLLPTSMTMSNSQRDPNYYFSKQYTPELAYVGLSRSNDLYINKGVEPLIKPYRDKTVGGNPQYRFETTVEGASWAGACRATIKAYKMRDDQGLLLSPIYPETTFQVLIGYIGWDVWSAAIEGDFSSYYFAPYNADFTSGLEFSKKITSTVREVNDFMNSAGSGWTYYQTFTEPTYYTQWQGYDIPVSPDCNKIMAASGFLALAFGSNATLIGNRAAAIQTVPRALQGIRNIAETNNRPVYFTSTSVNY
jgi:hypothetical protein